MSQINTFVTDSALPAGLANICHSRGIQVIEALPKPGGEIDEAEPPELTNDPIPIRRA
jgi:DeoR family glycerol-3-phosphate regulon repressor